MPPIRLWCLGPLQPHSPHQQNPWWVNGNTRIQMRDYLKITWQQTHNTHLFKGLLHTFNKSFDGLRHTGRDIQFEIFDKESSWTAVTWKTKKWQEENTRADLVAVKCKNMKMIELACVELNVGTGEFFGYHQLWVFICSNLQVLLYSITHVW